jgi:hypothetical protein
MVLDVLCHVTALIDDLIMLGVESTRQRSQQHVCYEEIKLDSNRSLAKFAILSSVLHAGFSASRINATAAVVSQPK